MWTIHAKRVVRFYRTTRKSDWLAEDYARKRGVIELSKDLGTQGVPCFHPCSRRLKSLPTFANRAVGVKLAGPAHAAWNSLVQSTNYNFGTNRNVDCCPILEKKTIYLAVIPRIIDP